MSANTSFSGSHVEPTPSQVAVTYTPRQISVYYITADELESLMSASNPFHLAFLGMGVGAAISVWATIETADLTDRAYAVFVAVLVVSVLLSVYCGFCAIRDWLSVKERKNKILSNGGTPSTGA